MGKSCLVRGSLHGGRLVLAIPLYVHQLDGVVEKVPSSIVGCVDRHLGQLFALDVK